MNFNIIVTSKCNLRCEYCYEENKKYQDMSIEVCDKTINFIIRTLKNRNEVNKLNRIVFHGGEPLLNFDLIKYIKNKLDIELENKYIINYMMTTNATVLNQEIIDFIKDNNIALSVSIDGTKYSHDQYRKFENGKGSYKLVRKNITELIKQGIKLRCRLTYRASTVSELYKGIVELSDLGIENFVPVADFYDTTWTEEEIDILEEEIDKIILDKKLKNLKVSIIDKENLCLKQSDCFGGIVSFTISEVGNIYPCVFVLGHKKFLIGNVFNNPCVGTDYAIKLFHERFEEKNGPCKTCEANEYCMGNRCKLINYVANGKYYSPSIINCNIMSVNLNTYDKLSKAGELNV